MLVEYSAKFEQTSLNIVTSGKSKFYGPMKNCYELELYWDRKRIERKCLLAILCQNKNSKIICAKTRRCFCYVGKCLT